jgi:SpoVK/Ycf46/Vps4 family AAA+-type ATPase
LNKPKVFKIDVAWGPSIIFFDEIDGLAPVRSSKQDQIHSSIVSTLLSLMDGLESRGQVVVIGATNRIDSIDPALRRPGRFDREFFFGLPKEDARMRILEMNTKEWKGVDRSMLETLAQMTHGYNGADVKQLCTEAALNAVRRSFPQIYKSDVVYDIPSGGIDVSMQDFLESMASKFD